jgi:Met-10+ like-protein
MGAMLQRLKHIVYLPWHALCLVLWKMTGGRRISVAGTTLKLEPATQVPKHRGYRFPRTNWSEEIVKYSDSVQMRSLLKVLCTCDKKMVIVEVGAFNRGYATILASIMAQRGGRFFAIEPNPDSFALLEKNIAKNHLEHIVSCWNVAIGEKEGTCSVVGDGSESQVMQRAGPFLTSKAEKGQVPGGNYLRRRPSGGLRRGETSGLEILSAGRRVRWPYLLRNASLRLAPVWLRSSGNEGVSSVTQPYCGGYLPGSDDGFPSGLLHWPHPVGVI